MSNIEHPDYPTESTVPEAAAYRPLSAAAVVSCLVGCLSPSAFFTPYLWAVAFAGIIVSILAWVRIHRFDPPLTGRTATIVGLVISLFSSAGGPSQWYVHRYLLNQEAQQFAVMFFDALLHDQPHRAHQLSLPATQRAPLDENLWSKYGPESNNRRDLEAFLGREEVRAIILLGKDPRTQVRFFDLEGVWREQSEDRVVQSYAVTYFDTKNVKKTFFVILTLNRYVLPASPVSDWYVSMISSFKAPHALEAQKAAWEKNRKKTGLPMLLEKQDETTEE